MSRKNNNHNNKIGKWEYSNETLLITNPKLINSIYDEIEVFSCGSPYDNYPVYVKYVIEKKVSKKIFDDLYDNKDKYEELFEIKLLDGEFNYLQRKPEGNDDILVGMTISASVDHLNTEEMYFFLSDAFQLLNQLPHVNSAPDLKLLANLSKDIIRRLYEEKFPFVSIDN